MPKHFPHLEYFYGSAAIKKKNF